MFVYTFIMEVTPPAPSQCTLLTHVEINASERGFREEIDL